MSNHHWFETLRFKDDEQDLEFNKFLLKTNGSFYTVFLRIAIGLQVCQLGLYILSIVQNETDQ